MKCRIKSLVHILCFFLAGLIFVSETMIACAACDITEFPEKSYKSPVEASKLYDIAPDGYINYEYAYLVLDELNNYRAEKGLDPLYMDEYLLYYACKRAKEYAIYSNGLRSPDGTPEYLLNIMPYTYRFISMSVDSDLAIKKKEDVAQFTYISTYTYMHVYKENYILDPKTTAAGIGLFVSGDIVYVCYRFAQIDTPEKKIEKTIDTEQNTDAIPCLAENLSLTATTKDSLEPGISSKLVIKAKVKDSRDYYFVPLLPTNISISQTKESKAFFTVQTDGTITGLAPGKGEVILSIDNETGTETLEWKVEITVEEAKKEESASKEEESKKDSAPKEEQAKNQENQIKQEDTIASNKVTEKFSDVSAGSWYVKAVQYALDNGIMNGTSATTFEPEKACTRTMMVQILWNAEGKQSPAVNNPFTDVKSSDWFYKSVLWAYENKITTGVSATEFGNSDVTREQMARFLMNYAKTKGYDTSARADLSKYEDAGQISGWATEAMQWANANGIINGTSATVLNPKGGATRAQVAKMIMNFQNRFGK